MTQHFHADQGDAGDGAAEAERVQQVAAGTDLIKLHFGRKLFFDLIKDQIR
jgi:hypothetical protein